MEDDIYNYKIALKADNDSYLEVGGDNGKYVLATGDTPVYFGVSEGPQ